MGGRGAASSGQSGFLPAAELEKLPYNVTGFEDELGGAVFPFLEQTGRAWHILTHKVTEAAEPHSAHTFGLAQPTLRWVNGNQVSDLYVDGMSTEQFLEATGLQLDLHKGAFVLSKRISRIMRPHFVSGFFEPDEVKISYMAQTPTEAKVWDGAGLISRRMLRKLVNATSHGQAQSGTEGFMLSGAMSPAKRERLEQELRHAQRVEFTIMTAKGQDKGHAIVADDLRDEHGRPVDFLLPQDTKKEVRLDATASSGARTFVGLSFVHGRNDMRLDIQSLINLHPFFREEQLLNWLRDEGALFTRAVETGQVAEAMGRIDRHTTLEDLQAWPLREYFASGGHPMWFRSHVKSLLNQHLKRLNHSTLEKMRLPIPGGRHYVMPAAVGQRAGIHHVEVPRGHIHIDDKRGTAWINDDDWLALPDSPQQEGIAGILGGADNDDALWLHPFTDHDGERKVLAWRSPNQVGEYVVLKPTQDSQALPWTAVSDDAVLYPAADSRNLPLRVDFTEPDYLNLVDPATAGGLGEGEAYSVEVMETAVARAIANQGALGMYCNSLMLNKALYGRLPDNPPAPLEDIIDSAVKTGADLSQVVSWNYANSRQILEHGTPMPALLHKRLSVDWSDKENRPPRARVSGLAPYPEHWLDRLERGIREHIRVMQQKRDELVAQARPPDGLFDQIEPEALRAGAELNRIFASTLNRRKQRAAKGKSGPGDESDRPVPNDASRLEQARLAVVDYLSHFPPQKRPSIMLGALASVYGQEKVVMDTAVWLGAAENEQLFPWQEGVSPAQATTAALREVGMLDEVIQTKEGLVIYPGEMSTEE
jgi:hypothetical protein